jgi:hypothetical protein
VIATPRSPLLLPAASGHSHCGIDCLWANRGRPYGNEPSSSLVALIVCVRAPREHFDGQNISADVPDATRDVLTASLKLIAHDKEHSRAFLATRLSITIRWLAGDSYLDICVTHNIAVSSFFANCDAIIESINEFLVIRFHPADTDEHDRQSKAFGRGVSPLSGCVGAIDGPAV